MSMTSPKIFFAGATGALGSRLVPLLVERGYDVVAMTRSPGKVDALRAAGAEPVVADGLDRDDVFAAVARAAPDVVLHQMTGLADVTSFKDFDEALAATNRLRIEGTGILLEAARAAGARVIAQSYGQWRYAGPGPLHTEDEPLEPDPPAAMTRTAGAVRHLESAVTAAAGTVLRYGFFYGPGTGFEHMLGMPLIGAGTGVWSFIHTDDAATAALAAIERGAPGVYNVADDTPVPIGEWLPRLAPEPPLRLSEADALPVAGEAMVHLHTRIQGLSNAKARRELDWAPARAGIYDGFLAAR
jgi:nucleoside-diphosphate-sugar epimerase